MILHELYCDNFIKFKSPQTINFAAGKKHITFINGDGRAGKTTIFRAIRWALYGNTGDEYILQDGIVTRKEVRSD